MAKTHSWKVYKADLVLQLQAEGCGSTYAEHTANLNIAFYKLAGLNGEYLFWCPGCHAPRRLNYTHTLLDEDNWIVDPSTSLGKRFSPWKGRCSRWGHIVLSGVLPRD
jgi:hypothetical protein